MAFTDQKNLRDRSSGIAGVIVVHAGLAALVVFGLATEVTKEIFSGPMPTREYKDSPPPEPQPKQEKNASESVVTAPLPTKPMPDDFRLVVPPIVDPPFSDDIKLVPLPPLDPIGSGKIGPDIAASPRNNAARWVTDSDYKSRWIREDMYGSASFRLEVAVNGRVENCQITRSTGHAALDRATCDLIAERARFNPAKDGSGNAITGSYSGSINWVLPE